LKGILKEYGLLAATLLLACCCFSGLYVMILPELKGAAPEKETVSNLGALKVSELAFMQPPRILISPIHMKKGDRKAAFSFLKSLENSDGKQEDMNFKEYLMKPGRCVYRNGESRVVIECEEMDGSGYLNTDREQSYPLMLSYRDSYSRQAKRRVTVLVTAHGTG
jgi:hypothetical protein